MQDMIRHRCVARPTAKINLNDLYDFILIPNPFYKKTIVKCTKSIRSFFLCRPPIHVHIWFWPKFLCGFAQRYLIRVHTFHTLRACPPSERGKNVLRVCKGCSTFPLVSAVRYSRKKAEREFPTF